MNNGIIIQARLSSTRFPNKVIKKLPYNSNLTVLEQVIKRCKLVTNISKIIVATTTNQEDKIIEEISIKNNVEVFRGSLNNVLERYYLAAKENELDNIIRITSDCPCIDYKLITNGLLEHINLKSDYTSNSILRSYPHGLDFEIITFKSLENAYQNSTKDYEREHVTPYIHTTKKDLFKIKNIFDNKISYSKNIRLTLDTEEDYALICTVYDFLYEKDNLFGLYEILDLFDKKPWLCLINKKIFQKKIFSSIEEEKKEAINLLKINEFNNIVQYLDSI